jgi:SacI restriction endonuclease
MADIDYDRARRVLDNHFIQVEKLHLLNKSPVALPEIEAACIAVFNSNTQAYREVLLGCVVAKLTDPKINIRQPYVDQGEAAFSGRTLDEKVINPFLQAAQIPCSRGPYLAVFRRGVQFVLSTRGGLKDKSGYDALLQIFDYIEVQPEPSTVSGLLDYVLHKFIALREEADIQIARLPRISLGQYSALLAGLLGIPSGGRIPVILVVAMLKTIKAVFKLDWEIEYAGINVADAAAGASGDITVKNAGVIVMILEVTERPVEASRVRSTFRAKIATSGVVDYLFLVNLDRVSPEAVEEARKYFAQGYEVNFIDVTTWVLMCLATLGVAGRSEYNTSLTKLFGGPELPNAVKVGWNEEVLKLMTG